MNQIILVRIIKTGELTVLVKIEESYFSLTIPERWEETDFEIVEPDKELNNKIFTFNNTPVRININLYCSNWIYMALYTLDNELYSDITVNLEDFEAYAPVIDRAFIDTNNLIGIESFLIENEIGKYATSRSSGFCSYPLYLLNVPLIYQLCPEQFQKFYSSLD